MIKEIQNKRILVLNVFEKVKMKPQIEVKDPLPNI